MRNIIQIIIPGFLLLFASHVNATTVSFILDQSDRFEDGVDYLQVTLTDDDPSGLLSVSVEMLPALAGLLDERGGIKGFSFNVRDYVLAGDDGLAEGDFDLPNGWDVSIDGPHHPMMRHDIWLSSGGMQYAQDPLVFTIAGLTVDDLGGGTEFAAMVTGLPGTGDGCSNDLGDGGECGSHALFYGARPVVVPVPAAAWLMGSGLLGLVGVARRRRQSSNGTGF